jgi:transaldolase/glucose-6-phosphate isomerase
MSNPLKQLGEAGQAVWLDFVQRDMLQNGGLAKLIADDGLTGITSNPSIFQKAISASGDYDEALRAFVADHDADPIDVFESLAIADIQAAADLLRPVYDRLERRDGYVSLEVSPYLALDTEATLIEARRLWAAVNRPNLMIKVPGTDQGVPAIRQLISEGINVNVTLLFSIKAYRDVAEAHIAGLEAFRAAGGDVSQVHGVASVFVSRIDGLIDKEIDARLNAGAGQDENALKSVRGQVAIANAKMAYQAYLELISTPEWLALAAAGAAPQRLLWASTGTKDPAYSDVLYVETLIGPDTVNTMPPKTMDAFRDHGKVAPTLTQAVDHASEVLATAARLGLDLDKVTHDLVVDGVKQFSDAADGLLGVVAQRRIEALGDTLNGQHISLPVDLSVSVKALTTKAQSGAWSRRLWSGDASLWTGRDEDRWLGWLPAARGERIDIEALEAFGAEIASAGFIHVLLLGMGGSSLGPEVMAETFGTRPGHPKLLVLDSTDPDQIARFEAQIDPAKTLFIVASKSGSTLEPDILHRYFFDVATKALGGDAGASFVAITDPGSQLEATARAQNFRHIFLGDPKIGGRYSVLSNFGMVPAAAAGIDVRAFIASTQVMTRACSASAPPTVNPGVSLGLAMGAATLAGRDKLTLIASPGLADVGAWLEQLIAESTGKLGKGLVPVDGEPLVPAADYGADRLFAYLRLEGHDQPELDGAVREIEEAGHPVVRITLEDRIQLGQEFVRWEVATAIAGAVLEIHPFDQPDVEASKIKTKDLTTAYEQTGQFAAETPILERDGIALFADAANAEALSEAVGSDKTLEGYLAAHFKRAGVGDYLALLAYIDRDHAHIAALQGLRERLLRKTKLATVLEFGPRFLHSTGQAYKGGPATGVFLQITHAIGRDLDVPGKKYSFGVVVAAQAAGDLGVLAERGRRHLRVHLSADVEESLKRLIAAAEAWLG